MGEIPDDIMKAACVCVSELPIIPDGWDEFEVAKLIAKAILAERQRIASDLFNRPGFMTNNSVDGKHWIEISFKTGEETFGLYNALVRLSQWKDLPKPPEQDPSEAPPAS
ncbi:hypothetical protein [Rhizobium sp. NZLR11]|uniref:hypothetical protein n=1 Tax=Rhizobium sp. NZLR11 TaxID=2731098 RepID=UPI001C82BD1A|nr:hypothetical protein [Rhizobium sp. NZLR11]MBX5206716.1 hypothetical protein [Rhizobium sp. NZLR11]